MVKLPLPRTAGIPAAADRGRAPMLLGAAIAVLVVTLGGCAGDRDPARTDAQRDTMSHGGTESTE